MLSKRWKLVQNEKNMLKQEIYNFIGHYKDKVTAITRWRLEDQINKKRVPWLTKDYIVIKVKVAVPKTVLQHGKKTGVVLTQLSLALH